MNDVFQQHDVSPSNSGRCRFIQNTLPVEVGKTSGTSSKHARKQTKNQRSNVQQCLLSCTPSTVRGVIAASRQEDQTIERCVPYERTCSVKSLDRRGGGVGGKIPQERGQERQDGRHQVVYQTLWRPCKIP